VAEDHLVRTFACILFFGSGLTFPLGQAMTTEFYKNRKVWCGGVLLVNIVLIGLARVPVLREMASFLIIEDSLEPGAAIVALGGGPPFREMEAARLYHAGWAPRVVIVRGARREESKAFEELGIAVGEGWELSREVLIRKGVPPSAILVPNEEAEGTLEELHVVLRALRPDNAPVILVTSKYHTRRTRLTWHHVTEGRLQAIVRSASRDPFDPSLWWHERRFILSVVREYLGLLHYYAGFPIPGRKASYGEP
jgi:uncharacterized SAM-binding protein YcdF (DUF218 family)